MAGRPIELDVETREFVELSQHLAKFAPELRKQMRKRLTTAARPAVKAVRAEVRSAPTAGGQSRGLRAGIAKGIRTDLSDRGNRFVGLRIRATSSGLSASQKGMQRKYNLPSFRHPVFGDRSVWVEQAGHPYFYEPIRKHHPAMRAAFEAAVAEAVAEIARK